MIVTKNFYQKITVYSTNQMYCFSTFLDTTIVFSMISILEISHLGNTSIAIVLTFLIFFLHFFYQKVDYVSSPLNPGMLVSKLFRPIVLPNLPNWPELPNFILFGTFSTFCVQFLVFDVQSKHFTNIRQIDKLSRNFPKTSIILFYPTL